MAAAEVAGGARVHRGRRRCRVRDARASRSLSRHRERARGTPAGFGGLREAVGDGRARDEDPDDSPAGDEPRAPHRRDQPAGSVPRPQGRRCADRRHRAADAARHPTGAQRRRPDDGPHGDDCVLAQLPRPRPGHGRPGGEHAGRTVRQGEHAEPRGTGLAHRVISQGSARRDQERSRCAGTPGEQLQAAAHQRAAAADGGQSLRARTAHDAAPPERRVSTARARAARTVRERARRGHRGGRARIAVHAAVEAARAPSRARRPIPPRAAVARSATPIRSSTRSRNRRRSCVR